MVSLQDGPSLPARGGQRAAQGLVDHALSYNNTVNDYMETLWLTMTLRRTTVQSIFQFKRVGECRTFPLSPMEMWSWCQSIIPCSFCFSEVCGVYTDMNLVFRYQVLVKPRDPDHFSQIWRSCTQSPPDLVLISKVIFTLILLRGEYCSVPWITCKIAGREDCSRSSWTPFTAQPWADKDCWQGGLLRNSPG